MPNNGLVQYTRKQEIAASLQIGLTTLDRWVNEGRLKLPKPFRPTQRSTLYDASLVKEAIDEMVAQS